MSSWFKIIIYSRGAEAGKNTSLHPHHTKGLTTDSDNQIPTDHLFDIRIYKLWGQWLGMLWFLRGGYIITLVMMDNWCVITIFDLALGLSRQVSHSLLAHGFQFLFSSDQSHPSQWHTNILLVNPSNAPHVKSHQRKMLILFTLSCRDSGKILTSQMKNSFSRRSPSRVRLRQKRARLLLIVLLQLPQTIFVLLAEVEIHLTEAQNQKLALELEVLRLRQVDSTADVNTENSGTQPTSEKTRKKRTVDWPHCYMYMYL